MFWRLMPGIELEAGHVDLVVEVADVADDGVVLHLRHVLGGDDVLVAGGGDEDVADVDDVLDGGDLEAVHARLERADGVDLGDDDAGAWRPSRPAEPLPTSPKPATTHRLAREHDVGRAHDAVGERVAAAVDVVELRLGDAVVDVDGREEELVLVGHLDEAVDAGGRLLGDADAGGHDLVPALGVLVEVRVLS